MTPKPLRTQTTTLLFVAFLLSGCANDVDKQPLWAIHAALYNDSLYFGDYFSTFQNSFLNIIFFIWLFTLFQYWQNRRQDYLYYTLYLGITWLYFARAFPPYFYLLCYSHQDYEWLLAFLRKGYNFNSRSEILFFHGLTVAYILFVQAFFDFKNTLPRAYQVTNKGIRWLLFSSVLFMPAFVIDTFQIDVITGVVLKHLYLLPAFWLMAKVISARLPGATWIVIGSGALLVGCAVTGVLHFLENEIEGRRVFLQIGVLAEILFFGVALGCKNFHLRQQYIAEIKEKEAQIKKEIEQSQKFSDRQRRKENRLQVRIRNQKKQIEELKEKLAKRHSGHDGFTPPPVAPESFRQKLERALSDNYRNSDFGIKQLALLMGLSPQTLNRRMKRLYNKSSIEYLTYYRIEQSKTLMSDPTLSLKEIAHRVGFNQYEYYSKQFEKKTGIFPKEFRSSLHPKTPAFTGVSR